MKNIDKDIDKVLTGLRQCEAPAGMEDRILRMVKDRAATQVVLSRHAWMSGKTLAAAAAILLICAVGLAGLFSMNRENRLQGTAPIRLPQSMPAMNASREIAVVSARPDINPYLKKNSSLRARTMHHASVSGLDTLTAGYPAPPLSLTRQEKLLLHVAHHANSDDLLLLSSEQQAVQLAKVNKDFDSFFEQAYASNKGTQ